MVQVKPHVAAAGVTAAAKRVSNGNAQLALELVGFNQDLAAAMQYVFGNAFICKVELAPSLLLCCAWLPYLAQSPAIAYYVGMHVHAFHQAKRGSMCYTSECTDVCLMVCPNCLMVTELHSVCSVRAY